MHNIREALSIKSYRQDVHTMIGFALEHLWAKKQQVII